MSNLPVICLVTAAQKDNANLVWAAWGQGPTTFGNIKLTSVADPAYTETPTHYAMANSGAQENEVAIMQAMANGDLPPIAGVWGDSGVISAGDALTATNGSNLQVYSASGNIEPMDHFMGILISRSLYRIPGPPI
jgi:hypothetical protein